MAEAYPCQFTETIRETTKKEIDSGETCKTDEGVTKIIKHLSCGSADVGGAEM